MKKLMLSTAVAAFAFVVSPAMAQEDSGVKLNVGGYFKGYVNYADQDDGAIFGDTRDFDILRDTEVHFGGETTLDNGLTVGAQIEARADQGEDFAIDESYVYMAGSWGRVNFGDEDGAAYLLQVAAPSADDNVDGIRAFITPVAFAPAVAGVLTSSEYDYDNDLAGDADKVTYLTPVFNGFQAGVSYTPQVSDESRALNGNIVDDGSLEDIYEVAARYEGVFNTVGVILGAGYTGASDDTQEWNVGADLDIGAFGVGAVYTESETEVVAVTEQETWVAGVDYTTGPFKVGFSYMNKEADVAGTNVDADRYTGGVVYSYGPGMSFRGSVAYHDVEGSFGGASDDADATTVTVGTQINF